MDIRDFLQDVARGAGRIQKDKYLTISTWREKSAPGDIVTEVDLECEHYITSRIISEFPNAAILSEESGRCGGDCEDALWIVDPLDGTRNYAVGIPFFCVSIGIATSGKAETGCIYDPIHDELFYASRGQGAFLNDRPISVLQDKSIEDGIVSVAWVKHKVERQQFMRFIEELSRETSYFRRLGSAALAMAYVACGRFSGYLQGGLCPWDVAAGIAIIEEAGGKTTDFEGRPLDVRNSILEIVTANPRVHESLMENVVRKTRSRR